MNDKGHYHSNDMDTDPSKDPAVTKSTIEFFTVKYPEPAHNPLLSTSISPASWKGGAARGSFSRSSLSCVITDGWFPVVLDDTCYFMPSWTLGIGWTRGNWCCHRRVPLLSI